MAFTKVAAPAKTESTNVLNAKDARNLFKKVDIHFPDGVNFQITGFEVVQFSRDGSTPSPDARRHVILNTTIDDLALSALYNPKYELDINQPSKPAVAIYPDGSLTKKFDELIDASNDDIETLVEKNIEMLKTLKLKTRRRTYYGVDVYGNKKYLSQLNIDIVE